MKPRPQNPGGRPIDYLRRCIVMEVQLEKRCSRRTAERQLSARNWRYDELLTEHPVACLTAWERLSEFDQGRYVGILESQVADMKAERRLK